MVKMRRTNALRKTLMKKKTRAIETCQELGFKYGEKICTSARIFLAQVKTSRSNHVENSEASEAPRGIECCSW